MRHGIAFDGMEPLGEMIRFARRAEATGFHSVWMAEHLCYRDAITSATAFLHATRVMKVVPTAISPYARHPMLLAMSAATMDELAPGRVRLMLGTGSPVAFAEAGIDLARPTSTLREAIQLVRRLLTGEFVRFEGEVFHTAAPRLAVVPRAPVPILLAAMGPRMLRLGGELADGVSLSSGSSPAYFRWAAGEVRAGAEKAGRAPDAVSLSGFIHVSTGPRRREAIDAIKPKLAYVLRLPVQRWNLEATGTELDTARIAAALERRDFAAAAALMPDEVVARHAVAGDYDDCLARIAEYRATGVEDLVWLAATGRAGWRHLLELKRRMERAAGAG